MSRKNTAVVALIVILVVAAGAGLVHAESEGLVSQARNAFYAGDYEEEAQANYEKALELDPEHEHAEMNLKRVLSKMQK